MAGYDLSPQRHWPFVSRESSGESLEESVDSNRIDFESSRVESTQSSYKPNYFDLTRTRMKKYELIVDMS